MASQKSKQLSDSSAFRRAKRELGGSVVVRCGSCGTYSCPYEIPKDHMESPCPCGGQKKFVPNNFTDSAPAGVRPKKRLSETLAYEKAEKELGGCAIVRCSRCGINSSCSETPADTMDRPCFRCGGKQVFVRWKSPFVRTEGHQRK
jgi:hypothetical protein